MDLCRANSLLERLAALAPVGLLFLCVPSLHAQSESQPAEPSTTVTLALGGDTMLARLVGDAILRFGPAYPWGDVLPLLQSADVSLINLECVIAEGGSPFLPPRDFYFNAPPEALESLRLARIAYVSLANNHMMDYEADALLECVWRLDSAGIAHAGAGGDLEAASRSAFIERKDVKFAVISCADHYLEYAARDDSPGTRVIHVRPSGKDFDWIASQIASARAAGAQWVLFSIHWGPNMREFPTRAFVDFAHAVIDASADVFHGHSAHVFQGVELYNGKPIFYDMGDLVDDYAVDPYLRNDETFLALLTLEGGRITRIELVPLLISDMRVNLAPPDVAEKAVSRLERRCAPFKTQFLRSGSRLLLPLP